LTVGRPDDRTRRYEVEPYRWAEFASGGSNSDGVAHSLRCLVCESPPASVVIEIDKIPEARCSCAQGHRWSLFLTHLQALRLALADDEFDWLSWRSEGARARALSHGVSAAMALWVFPIDHG